MRVSDLKAYLRVQGRSVRVSDLSRDLIWDRKSFFLMQKSGPITASDHAGALARLLRP